MHVDVRVISATHRDLRQGVADGWFREDLFYRLCVLPLQVPALRDRPEDIPVIAAFALDKVASETGRQFQALPPSAMESLQEYPWPGNVRELINTVQRAVVDASGDEISLTTLIPKGTPKTIRVVPSSRPGALRRPRGADEKLDVPSVQRALDQACGNHTVAAELLGVARSTLYRYLTRHGMH